MSYTIDRLLEGVSMEEAEARTRAALVDAKFGVLTEIDVKATLKMKIDKDVPGYKILGACQPMLASQMIELEPTIGVLMPCNVVLREVEGGVEVSAMDPRGAMAPAANPEIESILADGYERLAGAVANI
ncbi:MAG TPA: DUF302 domain-containing protein [Aliiroseovarius sp.]|nr:DUF302 domain-containing protein [Aliiroseovarius sp.]